ncbi:hypothetical protein [Clostridium fungisolvens]|uniref:Uncharacterized protein n=1 Tax=Clostridium fungisolvens TaxID=1604897 RepID=A0A6V8SFH9_9CLOT|nr:hypothetical protein [Clostridium fungisolvens]GFP75810.1 hypothetical protein bsdtw1_01902 [Clostridium fungisolvens]
MFATSLASMAVIAFLIANVQKYKIKKDGKTSENVPISKIYGYILALAAGAVTSNGLFHFLHGILGYGEFPAPFAKVLGRGIPADISNILWGLFNFIAAFVLISRCKKSENKYIIALSFIIGATLMSFLLKFVFLLGYFKSHAF